MLFNSLVFPLFLFLVLTLHWLHRDRQRRNLILLIASYVFYACWDVRFLSLIVLSSLVDYWCGLRIAASQESGKRRIYLGLSLAMNLGLLGVFKYFGFFVENAAGFLSLLGIRPDWPTINILIPVGISFYTFQTLSYTIDVYRGKCPVCRDLRSFLLFVSFFPQLVAGPIEKASNLLPQLQGERHFSRRQAMVGVRYILLGYLLKCAVADNMAPIVNEVYPNAQAYSGAALTFATYCFAFQIYGDFAGYSYIAIGVAALFGVKLQTNFNAPYLSQTIREFWRRWHISLSSWFSEYVYIGLLGGSRVSRARQVGNVVATFVISGLWHGANWTFVLWGLLNGLMYYVPAPFVSDRNRPGIFVGPLAAPLNVLGCFHMTCCAWIFFRAASIEQAFQILARIVSWSGGTSGLEETTCLVLGVVMLLVMAVEAFRQNVPRWGDLSLMPVWARYALYYAALLLLFFGGSFDRQPFIYFQF